MNYVRLKVKDNSGIPWRYPATVAEKSYSYQCRETYVLSCCKHLIHSVKKILTVENPVYFKGDDKCDISGLA